jgi:hypothetical protein
MPGTLSIGRPDAGETAPYYAGYIQQVTGDDIIGILSAQRVEALAFLTGIAEDRSLHRYAPGKWSMRDVLAHVNDCERLFTSRAFWFARAFDTPLPSFEQDAAAAAAMADARTWADHIEEFRTVRDATLSMFSGLSAEAWMRRGIASGNPFSVRGLAYVAAGHVAHHLRILRERYL